MSLTLRQKSGREKMKALVILWIMMMIAVVAFTTKRRNKEYKTSTTQKSEKKKKKRKREFNNRVKIKRTINREICVRWSEKIFFLIFVRIYSRNDSFVLFSCHKEWFMLRLVVLEFWPAAWWIHLLFEKSSV